MKLWLALPALPPGQELRDYARAAEAAGAEGVTVAEHLIIPGAVGDYPYTGQQAQMQSGMPFPDPLTLIADLAAHTASLRFMTNMLIAPLFHPLVLARQAATVAALSGGRLELGLGAGWMREEFDAIGVPFEERGSRMNEIMDLLPRLWTSKAIAHQGKHFQFEAVEVPTPACSIPIYVGGNSDFALKRAARAADGWAGIALREEELAQTIVQISAAAREHRDPARPRLQIRTLLKGRVDDERLAAHARAGVDALILQNWQVTGKKPYEPHSAAEVGEKLAQLTAACAALDDPAKSRSA